MVAHIFQISYFCHILKFNSMMLFCNLLRWPCLTESIVNCLASVCLRGRWKFWSFCPRTDRKSLNCLWNDPRVFLNVQVQWLKNTSLTTC